MIDVRDTFFQSDPFSFLPTPPSKPTITSTTTTSSFTAVSSSSTSANSWPFFYVFRGVEDRSISQCGWNGGWVKDCFGENTLARIGNEKIICSGVSVGSRDLVLQYIKDMSDLVTDNMIATKEKFQAKNIVGRFPKCERNGVDQGTHNVLVYSQMIPSMKIFDQSSGPVANLQAKVAIVRANEGEVVNTRGERMPVVHQYDRFPDLQKRLFEKVNSINCYYKLNIIFNN
jgi:hypothetical protein